MSAEPRAKRPVITELELAQQRLVSEEDEREGGRWPLDPIEMYFSYAAEPSTTEPPAKSTGVCGMVGPAAVPEDSTRRSQAAVVAQERNAVVF
jgi:hypothetical protein